LNWKKEIDEALKPILSLPFELQEILALGKAGWSKYDEAEFNGVHLHFYRKPKRFGSLKNFRVSSQTTGLAT
jgi:hypothetical protein